MRVCVTYLCGPPFVMLLPCTTSALEAMTVVLGSPDYQTVFPAWAGQQSWCIRRGYRAPELECMPCAHAHGSVFLDRSLLLCTMAPTLPAQELAP